MKLNLGCGNKKIDGFVNVDCVHQCKPDVICYLDQEEWPWEDNSVDEIFMCHSLEHMGATKEEFFHVLKEMYRVCQNGALIKIIVPHPNSYGFQGDPTHVRVVNEAIMALFSQRECRERREKGFANTPLGEYIGVDFDIISTEYSLFPEWQKKKDDGMSEDELHSAILYYNNVACEIIMVLAAIKTKPLAGNAQ